MSEKHLDELSSQQLPDNLREGAEEIFQSAFDSARADGLDEEGARRVAWNTVQAHYFKGEDGSWHRQPEDSNIHHKAIQSGGN